MVACAVCWVAFIGTRPWYDEQILQISTNHCFLRRGEGAQEFRACPKSFMSAQFAPNLPNSPGFWLDSADAAFLTATGASTGMEIKAKVQIQFL